MSALLKLRFATTTTSSMRRQLQWKCFYYHSSKLYLQQQQELKKQKNSLSPTVEEDDNFNPETDIVMEEEKIDRILKEPVRRDVDLRDSEQIKSVVEEAIDEAFPVSKAKKMELEKRVLREIQEQMTMPLPPDEENARKKKKQEDQTAF